MSSIDWHILRVWKGSQHAAFEELICQLAATETMPPGSKFTRKGTPDAGVECFWALPNGDESAWQAKFFRAPPDAGQWSQIDDSVKTALEKHPRLTRYTVCLPVDRADPRRGDQTSALDRWNERVRKWEAWATTKGMAVTFEFWGDHEIGLRLTGETHRGRVFYWFNQEKFSRRWFSDRVEEAAANVGPRYTPHLNVALPVARLFDGLGRTGQFYDRIDGLLVDVKKQYAGLMSWTPAFPDLAPVEALRTSFLGVLARAEAIDRSGAGPIDFPSLVRGIDEVQDLGRECVHSLHAAGDAFGAQPTEGQKKLAERYRHLARKLDQFLTSIHGFSSFCEGDEARLASRPYLLLTGDAGTGKTHLFCDVAMRRTRAGVPTVLLNGIQFTGQEPWSQILQLLGLDCPREAFLGSLDALAEAKGTRALLMIDALNEGEGTRLWKTHLAGVLRLVSRYPRIAVALSVRTSYEAVVVPTGLVPDPLLREEHHGFDDHEFEATTAFFRHYKIARPSVPLLLPEFKNPLFLKLFCEGLRNRGLSEVPPGLAGVTAIFEFFIESVEAKLSSPTALDYDPASRLTRRAIARLARRMADTGTTRLSRAEAASIVNESPVRDGFERSLFRHLLSEGVLLEDRRRVGGEWEEVVHFCYERFSDHMIASALLDDHLNPADVSGSFSSGSPLGRYFSSSQTSSLHQGLLNAFAVQLPERARVELFDATPGGVPSGPLLIAFIESIVWREPLATTPGTDRAVGAILACEYGVEWRLEILDALVTVGTKEGHPFNADRLHQILWPVPMAERDVWWSTYLHHQWSRKGAASVLVHWAIASDPQTYVDDVALLRAVTILGWCLSTPNRFVRDQATKALVTLLDQRIGVLRRLLDRFIGVNDPYVAERLQAVALGCAMRSRDASSVAALGQDVYDQVFRGGTPPVDIMLRAYARETVEESVRRGLSLSGDPSLIRPPHDSCWDPDVPTEDDLRQRAEATAGGGRGQGVYSLTASVLRDGDFSRYVLGTNAGGVPWSSIPLSEPIEVRSMRFRFHRFVSSLRPEQRTSWDEYTSRQLASDLQVRIKNYTQGQADGPGMFDGPDNDVEPAGESSRAAPQPHEAESDTTGRDVTVNSEQYARAPRADATFIATLDVGQRAEYEAVAAYPENRHRFDEDDAFDDSLVERWILRRVLDLGWRSDRHGPFDSAVQEHDRGRDAHKPERIGKKYQWIALHECYARLGDNFHFREDRFADEPQEYRGPWQLSVLRDIDPTCTFTGAAGRTSEESTTWHLPPSYHWPRDKADGEWLRAVEDFPDVRKIVSVVNPSDREEWLVLRCGHDWAEPRLGPGRVAEYPYRRIYCLANAYLIAAADYDAAQEWARSQDYMNHWMPECRDLYPLFYGEFYSSPAFGDALRADPELFRTAQGLSKRIPFTLEVPLVQYIHEASGFDCSIDANVSLYLPSPLLVEGLGLSGAGREGRYVGRHGELVALDTVTEEGGPSSFVVRRREFEEFLSERNLRVFWTVLGGKDIIHETLRDADFLGRFVLNGSLHLDRVGVSGRVSATMYKREGNEVLGAREV